MDLTLLKPLGLFAASNNCSKPFLGLETWFHYLPQSDFGGGCVIKDFTALGTGSEFVLIGLAILDDLIRIAALISVGYVIAGGIQYMTSQGDPGSVKHAQQTIINALIGLVVAILAASIVSFIGHRLGGLS